MKEQAYSRDMSHPDERREFQGHGHLDVLSLAEGASVGHGVFEPGWRWSRDVKPIAGTESCQASHTGYALKGSMVIHMDNGEEFRIKAGDAFRIPAGHDAWVDGNEDCELIDVTGYAEYAVPHTEESAAETEGRRKVMDCRDVPSDTHCSLVIAGREDEVLRAAVDHAIQVHGHQDSMELRDQIRRSLKDEPEEWSRKPTQAA